MPKFSIIVGIYNQASTLPAVIDAINRQTFRDFEVHFCDDGSDEDQDIKFTIIKHINATTLWRYHRQSHKGMRLAKNLNQGIRSAIGEYCVFIMADSLMEENYLEVLSQHVQPHRIINGIRVQVDNGIGVDLDWRIKKGVIPEFNTVLIGSPYACITGNGLTIPTEAMRLYGGWPEQLEGYGGDDNEIVARLFYKGYVVWSITDLRLYHHWHKGTQTSEATNDKVRKMIESYAH